MRVALEMASVGRIFNVDPQLLAIYEAFEFSGIFLMGVMGGLIALEREYDLFGFILIALVSAPGGVPAGGSRA